MKTFINKLLIMTHVNQIIWIHNAIWVPDACQEYARQAFEATKDAFKWKEIEVKETNLTEERESLIVSLRALPPRVVTCTIGKDLPRLPDPNEATQLQGVRPKSNEKLAAIHTASLLRFFKRKKLDFIVPSNLLPPLKKRKTNQSRGIQMQLGQFFPKA